MVVLFGVVARLEGDAEGAARVVVVGTADVDAGVRKQAALRKCLFFRGFLRILAVIREGEQAEVGQPAADGAGDIFAMQHRLREAALDVEQRRLAGASVDAAIREGRADARFDLDVPRIGADFRNLLRISVIDIQFAVRGIQNRFAHGHEMAETVVPVADAFRAVAVRRETIQKDRIRFLHGGEYFRAFSLVVQQDKGGSDHVARADGVPVVAADGPPMAARHNAFADDFLIRADHAFLDFFTKPSARFGLQFVLQPPVDDRQFAADGRAAKIRIKTLLVEVFKAAVMGGHDPAAVVEQRLQIAFQLRQEAAFVFQCFGQAKRRETAVALSKQAFEIAAVAVLSKLKIHVIRQFRRRRIH